MIECVVHVVLLADETKKTYCCERLTNVCYLLQLSFGWQISCLVHAVITRTLYYRVDVRLV